MTQLSAMSSTPRPASIRMPQALPHPARAVALGRRPAEERMSTGAYLLQGGAFIGFLLVLFLLAGFRG